MKNDRWYTAMAASLSQSLRGVDRRLLVALGADIWNAQAARNASAARDEVIGAPDPWTGTWTITGYVHVDRLDGANARNPGGSTRELKSA